MVKQIAIAVAVACGLVAFVVSGCRSTSARLDPEVLTRLAQTQVAEGRDLFVNHCAECHGPEGEGTHRAPAIVGPSALPLEPRPGSARERPFLSAQDIADYVIEYMPPNGDLIESEEDYWAIVAFTMGANGADLVEPVGPETAAEALVPRR